MKIIFVIIQHAIKCGKRQITKKISRIYSALFSFPRIHFKRYILQLSHEIKSMFHINPPGIKHLVGRQIITFRVPTHSI